MLLLHRPGVAYGHGCFTRPGAVHVILATKSIPSLARSSSVFGMHRVNAEVTASIESSRARPSRGFICKAINSEAFSGGFCRCAIARLSQQQDATSLMRKDASTAAAWSARLAYQTGQVCEAFGQHGSFRAYSYEASALGLPSSFCLPNLSRLAKLLAAFYNYSAAPFPPQKAFGRCLSSECHGSPLSASDESTTPLRTNCQGIAL